MSRPPFNAIRGRLCRRYRAGPILEWSGDVASRILADWDDTSAVVGTNAVDAATHHFGDPRRGIPARPFLGVDADARSTPCCRLSSTKPRALSAQTVMTTIPVRFRVPLIALPGLEQLAGPATKAPQQPRPAALPMQKR